jgi:3-dehydroquinate dehydratase
LAEKICVSIGANTIEELSSSINKALDLSDFLEIRFDFLDRQSNKVNLKETNLKDLNF